MKRRNFLIATSAGLCGLIGWSIATSSAADAIVRVLDKRLSYLKLDRSGVLRFAADLTNAKIISPFRLRVLDAIGPLYDRLDLSDNDKLDNAIRWGEDRVVTEYLLSSDFFKNGSDVSRVVHYLGPYDPLVACGNPFARPAVGDATVY